MLTTKDLGSLRCNDPDCDCDGTEGGLFIHSNCHPDSPTWVRIDKKRNTVVVLCAECRTDIVEIGVCPPNLSSARAILRRESILRLAIAEAMAADARKEFARGRVFDCDGEQYRITIEYQPTNNKRGSYCCKVFCREGEPDEYQYATVMANIRFWPKYYHALTHACAESTLWLDANGGVKQCD